MGWNIPTDQFKEFLAEIIHQMNSRFTCFSSNRSCFAGSHRGRATADKRVSFAMKRFLLSKDGNRALKVAICKTGSFPRSRRIFLSTCAVPSIPFELQIKIILFDGRQWKQNFSLLARFLSEGLTEFECIFKFTRCTTRNKAAVGTLDA